MSLLRLNPNEFLSFQPEYHGQTNKVTITNISDSKVAFKVRTTSPHHFSVSPANGIICSHQEIQVLIVLTPSEEAFTKVHKFQIQALSTQASDYSLVNWEGAAPESYKLSTQKASTLELPIDPMAKESVYFAPKNHERQKLELEKERLVSKNIEITTSNDAIKNEIEKAQHRLRYNSNFSKMLNNEVRSGYPASHLGVSFIIGVIASYFFFS